MADTMTVADRFLALARERNRQLTPMQLLKLVYIAHGWNLGLYGRPLINDDVQAWQYGPVIPRLYNAIRQFKGQPVNCTLSPLDAATLSANETSMVDQVFEIYGHMTGAALSRLTHAPKTPWDLTYVPGSFGLVIPNDIIADHYTQLAQERRSAQ